MTAYLNVEKNVCNPHFYYLLQTQQDQLRSSHFSNSDCQVSHLVFPYIQIKLPQNSSCWLLPVLNSYLTVMFYPLLLRRPSHTDDVCSTSVLLDIGTPFHTTFTDMIQRQCSNSHLKIFSSQKNMMKNY